MGKSLPPCRIDTLYQEALQLKGKLSGIDDARYLLEMIQGDRQATQEVLQRHYRWQLSSEQRRIGNVTLLCFERFVAELRWLYAYYCGPRSERPAASLA